MSHPVDETVDAWFARYCAYSRSLGRHTREYDWNAWISPVIGAKRWSDVTVADVENVRDRLDQAIADRREFGPGKKRLLGRTAVGIWHTLTGCARVARRSKRRDLRALDGLPNPCADVEPPGELETRGARRKTFIYPLEADRLLASRRVPRAWREVYAVAGYLYLRPGELMSLRWEDVDFAHRVVRIVRAFDFRDGTAKDTKTRAGIRDVPIPRALLPLLRRLHRERKRGEALVLPILLRRHRVTLPVMFRRHLRLAGITRAALHESSLSTARANFRSWRDSGITWLALAGVDVSRISRRAGHRDIQTTMGYVKQAEDLGGTLGKPFGRLPSELVRGSR